VRKALTNLTSKQFYSLETVDDLARNFGHYQDLFNDPGYFATFMKQVEGLDGPAVMKAGRKYLDVEGLTFVVMTPESEALIEPKVRAWVKDFRKSFRALKSKASKKNEKKAKKISFLFKKPKDLRGDVEKFELKNGVTVITRPNFETPVISLRCASLGGSRLETRESQGATELLSRVWTAGCGTLSEQDVNHKCDEMAASLSAFGGRNSEGLTMSCLRPFLDEMLHLFFATLTEPLFEAPAITREVKSMQEHVKLRQDNPSQLCILEFMKGMFGSHPYGHDPYGDHAAIGRLNQTIVRHIYRQKTGLAIVASGAFDPKELLRKIESELSAVKPGPLEIKKVPIQYPSQETRAYLKSEKQQSHIVMGYPGLNLRDPDRYTLQVLQAVLAGQGGRLFVELRDKASLAYSVAPLRMEGLEGGYFGAYIGCSPEKSGTALSMMKAEFTKLRETLVSSDELGRAQRYLIGKHDIELQRNSNLTSALLFDHIYGIDYLETFQFSERVRTVTAAGIRDLAEKIFSGAPVISLVGPSAPW
jgi:zinc protease